MGRTRSDGGREDKYKYARTLGVELVEKYAFGREDWGGRYGAGCFGDARDVAIHKASATRGTRNETNGNLPVYQDGCGACTYVWRVVIEEEKRVGRA